MKSACFGVLSIIQNKCTYFFHGNNGNANAPECYVYLRCMSVS